jgi:hypothetical protein
MSTAVALQVAAPAHAADGPFQATSAYAHASGHVTFSSNKQQFVWSGDVYDDSQDGRSGALYFRITLVDGTTQKTATWYDSNGAFTHKHFDATLVTANGNIRKITAVSCRRDLGSGGPFENCNDGSVLDNQYTG